MQNEKPDLPALSVENKQSLTVLENILRKVDTGEKPSH